MIFYRRMKSSELPSDLWFVPKRKGWIVKWQRGDDIIHYQFARSRKEARSYKRANTPASIRRYVPNTTQ